MKKWIICLAAQVVAWGVLTIEDFLEEKHLSYTGFACSYFVIPALFFILYIVFRKWIYDGKQPGMKGAFGFVGRWLATTVVCGAPIYYMACVENIWIVKQAYGGLENFLNSIEYMLYGFWLGSTLTIAILVLELIVRMVNKNKAKKAEIQAESCENNI